MLKQICSQSENLEKSEKQISPNLKFIVNLIFKIHNMLASLPLKFYPNLSRLEKKITYSNRRVLITFKNCHFRIAHVTPARTGTKYFKTKRQSLVVVQKASIYRNLQKSHTNLQNFKRNEVSTKTNNHCFNLKSIKNKTC